MAARKSRGESTPARTRRATQTIEQIEARAQRVRAEERDALDVLAHCMREIAVRCPTEGRLGLRLAQSAKSVELWSGGSGSTAEMGGHLPFNKLCRDLALDWPDMMDDD